MKSLSEQMLDSLNIDPSEYQNDEPSPVEQWHQERLGRFTSSKFDTMLKTGRANNERFSGVCTTYIYEKIAEITTQAPHLVTSRSMEWGHDHEHEATQEYEKQSGNAVDYMPNRFFTYGEWAGGTPDGLVGEDGITEVKCPYNPANHIETLLTDAIPSKYYAQVQGNLLVTGRKWCDFISYDPRQPEGMQLVVLRIERDDDFIEVLKTRLDEVVDRLKELMEKLKK